MAAREYVPVQIVTLPAGRALPFSLYEMQDGEYLPVTQEGEIFEVEVKSLFRDKKINVLYIERDQEAAYNEFVDGLYDELFGKTTKEVEKCVEVINQAKSALADLAEGKNVEKNIENSFKSVNEFYELYQKDHSLLKKLYGAPVGSLPRVIKHCSDVSMMATKFAMALGKPRKDVVSLGVAGLLHDIGFKKLREEETYTFIKDRKMFTGQMIKDYMGHVELGLKVLSGKPLINEHIERLIKYHEENLAGTGPYRLTKFSQDIEILSMINVFDKYRVYNPQNIKEVFKDFKANELGNYSLQLINIFGKFLLKEGMIEMAEMDALKLGDRGDGRKAS